MEEALEGTETEGAAAAELATRWANQVPWLEWLADYPIAVTGLVLVVLLLLVGITRILSHRYLLKTIVRFARNSPITWDELLVDHKVFHRLVAILPIVVLQYGIVFVPGLPEGLVHFIRTLAYCIVALFVARSLSAFLSAANSAYQQNPTFQGRPIKGFVQVLQVIIYLVVGILIVAALLDESPMFFLSGLGAMTAVLLLVFRDTLLSLVAGVQLSGNDLIRVGDWIEMPSFAADGTVVDIALNVVKVQNFDRTFTVIPTHKFLEHSFKNYRGMFNAGGRRMMRSIHLDLSTVRFLTPEEITHLRRIVVLRDYIDEKMKEVLEHNEHRIPEDCRDVLVNQRKLTNVGTFRAYVMHYLRNHPGVHQELVLLVRQLEPTPKGLPIQVYAFANDTRWAAYEGIQGDIFDHLISILPEFGLRAYQEPAGTDLVTWSSRQVAPSEVAVSGLEARPHPRAIEKRDGAPSPADGR